MVLLDLPLIVASFWSISAFYVIAQRELYPKNWKRSFLFLPMLMAVGVALTIINTRAVLEALFGVQSGFARTPKYAIGDRPMNLEVKKYRRRSGWLPYVELAVGTYFAGDDRVRDRDLQLLRDSRSCCCSWAAITGPASARCTRNIRAACGGSSSRNWHCARHKPSIVQDRRSTAAYARGPG